jgi:hypothetical protein
MRALVYRGPKSVSVGTGAIGTVGVWVPPDPQPADDLAGQGRLAFDFGTFFQKGLRMGLDQGPAAPVVASQCAAVPNARRLRSTPRWSAPGPLFRRTSERIARDPTAPVARGEHRRRSGRVVLLMDPRVSEHSAGKPAAR